MTYTIVYTDDDGIPYCYGHFTDRRSANRKAKQMERDLNPERDISGGGVGYITVSAINPLKEWLA